jgi:hypothetical protein
LSSKHLAISIGGSGFCFSFCRDNRLTAQLRARYAGYCSDPKEASGIVECRLAQNPGPECQEKVVLHAGKGGAWTATRQDFVAEWNDRGGSLLLEPSVYAFDAFLRVFLGMQLARAGKLLLHASAVATRTGSFIFPGTSGAGKTTISRLADPEDTVLNDEICVAGKSTAEGFQVSGTPFWGEMGSGPARPRPRELTAVYLLKQAESTRRRELAPHEAARGLLRCVCLFGDDPRHLQRALDVCLDLVVAIPVYELEFPRNATVWNALKSWHGSARKEVA